MKNLPHHIAQGLGLVPPNENAPQRFDHCAGCVLSKVHLGKVWCGTPVIGQEIEYNGKPVHLCGCNMNVKTKIDNSICAIGKW